MGNLTIRNLDDGVIETLKAQAKANQRSLEAEVRYVSTCLRLAGSAPDTSTLIGGETSNMTGKMIDLTEPRDELRYIVGHALTWQAGLDRLTGSCVEYIGKRSIRGRC